MPIYAILGATGQTGGSILRLLCQEPGTTIHTLVRSRSKLEAAYPQLLANDNIRVFEASISDTATLASCLQDICAVFLTAAVSENIPGVSIALDTAKAMVEALEMLEADTPNLRTPRLVVLSSATMDDKGLRQHESWLDLRFVMPGGLSHDVQRGHELSTESQQTSVGFLDLATSMIEVANADTSWKGKHVSVVLKKGRTGPPE